EEHEAERHDVDAFDRIAELVDDAPADQPHPRKREVHVVEGLTVEQLQRLALLERPSLAVTQRQISAARDANGVAAGGQAGQLVAAIRGGAHRPALASEFGRRGCDARPAKRAARIGGENAAANRRAASLRRRPRPVARGRLRGAERRCHRRGEQTEQPSTDARHERPPSRSLYVRRRSSVRNCDTRDIVGRASPIMQIRRLMQHAEVCVEGLIQDLRYAARKLAGAPAFTLAAVTTLAMGIGATPAIFSTVNATLLRPLPFVHPEELVALRTAYSDGRVTTGLVAAAEVARLNSSNISLA